MGTKFECRMGDDEVAVMKGGPRHHDQEGRCAAGWVGVRFRDGAKASTPCASGGGSAQRHGRPWQELSGFTALGGPYTAARRVEETVGEYTHPTRVRQHGCSGADSL